MLLPRFLCLVLPLLVVLTAVSAYIPALPTNDTNIAIAGGLNVTDVSKLHLQWFSNGSYWENVSYQLAGNGSQGISRGALVHFSEQTVNNDTAPTSTPWIALVACDANATNQSLVDDIFTLARDKGAVAALLFSLHSNACVINPEYADYETFDQVFDIFSTQSLISSHIIEYQFGQLGAKNESLYGSYDSKRLNESGTNINSTIISNTPLAPGYLFATLRAYNATGDTTETDGTGGGTANTSAANGNNSPNTALAMIILYACTGCVSALFCIVIISGAVRAIRHPERYGPRSARLAGGEPGQSRARGLTRAILDTFPIVKFGGSTPTPDGHAQSNPDKDVGTSNTSPNVVEPQVAAMETTEWELVEAKARPISTAFPRVGQIEVEKNIYQPNDAQPRASGSRESRQFDHTNVPPHAETSGPRDDASRNPADLGEGTSRNATSLDRDDVVPDAIGRETCPICIVDFEEGDDLRLLPCEGKHRFHQYCVDPWLLELSSSCPICRHDFLALETMLSADPNNDVAPHPWVQGGSPTHSNRFSRYLRFAKNRRNYRREEADPTDPPMPTAPETSM